MAIADINDANTHLPQDKIPLKDARFPALQIDSERVVRGALAGYFLPTTLASWTDPENTPGLIRSIAGRLIAALWYKERYSEDSLQVPQYAQDKYDEAMLFLQKILSGDMILEEVTEDDVGADRFTSADFYPNSDTDPKFQIEMPV